MKSFGLLGILGILCIFASQRGQAQAEACGGDYVCLVDDSAAAPKRFDQTFVVATLAHPAGSERCLGTPIDVTAASPDESRLACSAAYDAIQLLNRCGISMRRPLHVEIMTEVRHPFSGSIFGRLDTKRERALITQEANIRSLIEGTPYAKLPRRDFYKSLIVHEVVHGIMHQNLKRPATSHSAYEYPAYALQIESLAPQVRDTFMQSFERAAIESIFMFNDPILFMDPYYFAARAYHHFKASSNGCAHLTALLEGEVTFIAPSRL